MHTKNLQFKTTSYPQLSQNIPVSIYFVEDDKLFYVFNYQFGNRKNPLTETLALPVWKQVHGIHAQEVTEAHQECGEVDGLWTQKSGQPIAVVTADCVPILLHCSSAANLDHTIAVAALHAGWKGSFNNIVNAWFESLPTHLAKPTQWTAILGPSIRSCCYEVDLDLIHQFQSRYPEIEMHQLMPSHRKLDLITVIQYQLKSLGIQCIQTIPDCTYCSSDVYYSYRHGDRCSRQLSVIKF